MKSEIRANRANAAGSGDELVSIIIPCFNAAAYLDDAIRSVFAQTHPRIELIVVDDGSTDRTAEVARSYSRVTYVYQRNQGVSPARNTGLRRSIGNYVLFLDGDDRLLPNAVEAGLKCFRKYSESGFVFGRYRQIDAQGSIISSPTHPPDEPDFYAALLQGNLIGMPAIVLYARCVLEKVDGFQEQLSCCEDYDLYLRIARDFPVHKHNEIVAEYRRHDKNVTGRYRFMLEGALHVLRAQAPYVRGDPRYEVALAAGVSNWRELYGRLMLQDFQTYVGRHGLDRGSIQRFRNLAVCYPQGIVSCTKNTLRSMLHR